MASILLFFLFIFTFPSHSIACSRTLSNAAEILSDSGYLSMALTLQLTSVTLNLDSSNATIFAPLDSAFARSGQLSLLELQYHISPARLSKECFRSLPYGARIPTLWSNHSLIVTTDKGFDFPLSINNVSVGNLVIFDDGSMIVYGVDKFLDPKFEIANPNAPNSAPTPSPTLRSESSLHERNENNPFSQASDSLMSVGFTKMATFLDIQQVGFCNRTRLTIFAPVDEVIEANVKNFRDYSLIFRSHVVPGLLLSEDLEKLDDGASLPTFSKGFVITVTKSGDTLLINDVPVIYPDIYKGDWVVVHGLNQLVISSEKQGLGEESLSEVDSYEEQSLLVSDGYGIP
ncbi:hypothetical protein SLA2020_022510 [Shorea laevis]